MIELSKHHNESLKNVGKVKSEFGYIYAEQIIALVQLDYTLVHIFIQILINVYNYPSCFALQAKVNDLHPIGMMRTSLAIGHHQWTHIKIQLLIDDLAPVVS